MKFSYKEKNNVSERIKKHQKIIEKYKSKVPIVVESENFKMDSNLLIISRKSQLNQLMAIVRSRIKGLEKHEGLFLFINDKIYNMSDTIGEIYLKESGLDFALYVEIKKESVFGDFVKPF